MKARYMTVLIAGTLWVTGCMGSGSGLQPQRFTLENGIRVVLVPMPGSENVSIFTYAPMGMTWDDPGRAQWSHLVEHLAIRSTHAAGTQEANAETLPDHMRLDFYGTLQNWDEGLSYHAQWLRGTPFSEENLAKERVNANGECGITERNLATHKFAMAAWAQGYRHGRRYVAIKGDLDGAELGLLQQYRDERLAVLDKVVVCLVGNLDVETVKPVIDEKLGHMVSAARCPAPVSTDGAVVDVSWDLTTRHLVMTWPIPDVSAPSYAALYLAAALLQMNVFNDPSMARLTGNVFAGADLNTPEGPLLYVNAVLQPGVSFEEVRNAIEQHVRGLETDESLRQVPMFGQQLSHQLTYVADPNLIWKQAPAQVSMAMIEGNIGLQWGMREFQYGPSRETLAKNLGELNGEAVRNAVAAYLAPAKGHVLAIRPAEE